MRLNVNLSPSNIKGIIQNVESYKRKLNEAINETIDIVLDEGLEMTKRNIMSEGAFYNGELINSINKERDAKGGSIYTELNYAKFVEYGTGVIGQTNPHPSPPEGWTYDVNNHGEKGWVYYNEKEDKYYWTKGFPHRPFMYDTARELNTIKYDLLREVLNR